MKEVLALDKENGNDLWWKVIQKEMSTLKLAFKSLDENEKPPIGSQYRKCHMVFSIKMENFSQKPHLVAGGHMVEALTGFYPSPKSFWSCTHVNSCQKYALYINLHILWNISSKATSNTQESRKFIKSLKR